MKNFFSKLFVLSVLLIFCLSNTLMAEQWSFNANRDLYHEVGRIDNLCHGWSANVLYPKGFLTYGPYISSIPKGKYSVYYSLKVDNVSANNHVVATIDIYDSSSKSILARDEIRRKEFDAPFEEKIFKLDYYQTSNHEIEFRTYFHKTSYVCQRDVIVKSQNSSASNVVFDHYYGGIKSILINGKNICAGNGLYLVGSCTGSDDENNINSYDSDGHVMHSSKNCQGPPFNMRFWEIGPNILGFQVNIGPAPVDYVTISMPLDLNKDMFNKFKFNGNSYKVGCANQWETRWGSGSYYSDIPTPCYIDGHGSVGLAKTNERSTWGEVSGTIGTIKINILKSSNYNLMFYNHPYTNNMEFGFGSIKKGSSILLKGEIIVK